MKQNKTRGIKRFDEYIDNHIRSKMLHGVEVVKFTGKALRLRSKMSRVRFPASPLRFQRLVIQVEIWLKDRQSDVNPQ